MIRIGSVLSLSVGILFTALCSRMPASEPTLCLAKDKETDYFIVSPDKPTPDETTAITELSRYLEQMTGAPFPVVVEREFDKSSKGVFVGHTRLALAHGATGLDAEEWLIKPVSDHLLITGGRPRGTLYAVWVLLDSMGCTWASRDSEYIPIVESLTFGKTLTAKPTITMRCLYTAFHEQGWNYSQTEKEAEEWFRQRNGMNTLTCPP